MNNGIFRTKGNAGVECQLIAALGDNAQMLHPIGQMVEQLSDNRKRMALRSAIAERALAGALLIQFAPGMTSSIPFNRVTIDMASGRDPFLVFESTSREETVTVTFDQAVQADWLLPRTNAGCTWCGGAYTCAACVVARLGLGIPPSSDCNTTERHKAQQADLASTFMQELLDSVESLTAVAEEHGPRTLADLLYMHSAILDAKFIDHYPNQSKVLDIVRAMPSGEIWVKYIKAEPQFGGQ